MEDTKASLSSVIEKIEEMFRNFNEHFYKNELHQPVIMIIPKGKRKGMGWCSNVYHWEDKDKKNGYHEINIWAEFLALEFLDMAELLLHEMAHLYNTQHGIEDTSRSGTYHNRKYCEAATSHGLIVEKTSSYGWSQTSLSAETEKYIQALKPVKFDIARIEFNKQLEKKQSMRKLICPICGCSARVTSAKTKLLCGDCNTLMV